jgi:hypothetical protein
MTIVAGIILIVAVAAVVALPLARPAQRKFAASTDGADAEVFEHEKHVAMLAIKEAEFDRAMGKLSEEDYAALRGTYEERALGALFALDSLSAKRESDDHASSASAGDERATRFCAACGQRFGASDRFCRSCGMQRCGPAG